MSYLKSVMLASSFLLANSLYATEDNMSINQFIAHMEQDVVYKTIDNKTLSMDIYHSKHSNTQLTQGQPLAIWIHGGAWKRGDKSDFPAKNIQLAQALLKQGYVLASINYRLSHEATFPAPLEDCEAALQFLYQNAEKYHIDPTRIVIMGRSAGGHLATLTATKNAYVIDNEKVRINAVVSFFGVYDLSTLQAQKGTRNSGQADKTPEALLLGGSPKDLISQAKAASPMTFISDNTPPTLLLHGDKDSNVPVQQSIDFNQALLNKNVPTELIIVPNARHSDPIFDSEAYISQVLVFLNKFNNKYQ